MNENATILIRIFFSSFFFIIPGFGYIQTELLTASTNKPKRNKELKSQHVSKLTFYFRSPLCKLDAKGIYRRLCKVDAKRSLQKERCITGKINMQHNREVKLVGRLACGTGTQFACNHGECSWHRCNCLLIASRKIIYYKGNSPPARSINCHLPSNLMAAENIKKFLPFYGNKIFITAFTTAHTC